MLTMTTAGNQSPLRNTRYPPTENWGEGDIGYLWNTSLCLLFPTLPENHHRYLSSIDLLCPFTGSSAAKKETSIPVLSFSCSHILQVHPMSQALRLTLYQETPRRKACCGPHLTCGEIQSQGVKLYTQGHSSGAAEVTI